jgi:PHP family Zn ribbon phosphoesterase
MPWCATCDHYLAPPAVRPDGGCPTCGQPVEKGEIALQHSRSVEEAERLPPVPWHLKLLALAVLIYLLYRLYQGILWLVH